MATSFRSDNLLGYRVKVMPWCWGMVPDKTHSVVTMHRSSHRLIRRFAQKREERIFVMHHERLIVTTEKGKQELEKVVRELEEATKDVKAKTEAYHEYRAKQTYWPLLEARHRQAQALERLQAALTPHPRKELTGA